MKNPIPVLAGAAALIGIVSAVVCAARKKVNRSC